MYSLRDYGRMIADRTRLSAYRRALQRSVTPGCVVADVGTGAGVMALLACRLGARRVYAVDTSDAISVAMALAKANGMADRIVFVQADCREFQPPEPVDVAVADLRGILPLFPGNLGTLDHVRRRWLGATGTLIPAQDILRVAPVRSARLHRQLTGPWAGDAGGVDLRPALRWALNQATKVYLSRRELIGAPRTWATLDYRDVREPEPRTLHWSVSSAGPSHGFAVWFDTRLVDGIGFSNAPGKPRLIYGQAYFAFETPLALARGDRLELALSAAQPADECVWSWTARVVARGGRVRQAVRQSTFLGQLIGPAQLHKREGSYRPTLGPAGRATLAALEALGAGRSVDEATQAALAAEASLFSGSPERARAFVADISGRFS